MKHIFLAGQYFTARHFVAHTANGILMCREDFFLVASSCFSGYIVAACLYDHRGSTLIQFNFYWPVKYNILLPIKPARHMQTNILADLANLTSLSL